MIIVGIEGHEKSKSVIKTVELVKVKNNSNC